MSIKSENEIGTDFRDIYPFTDPELIKILQDLLQFNPYFRPSAADCLKSKLFDDIRISDEDMEHSKIECKIDIECPSDYHAKETHS